MRLPLPGWQPVWPVPDVHLQHQAGLLPHVICQRLPLMRGASYTHRRLLLPVTVSGYCRRVLSLVAIAGYPTAMGSLSPKAMGHGCGCSCNAHECFGLQLLPFLPSLALCLDRQVRPVKPCRCPSCMPFNGQVTYTLCSEGSFEDLLAITGDPFQGKMLPVGLGATRNRGDAAHTGNVSMAPTGQPMGRQLQAFWSRVLVQRLGISM